VLSCEQRTFLQNSCFRATVKLLLGPNRTPVSCLRHRPVGSYQQVISFRKNGESISLIDTDINNNQILDSVTFGEQKPDIALGRQPDGTGKFELTCYQTVIKG